jgi:hypothetical protein
LLSFDKVTLQSGKFNTFDADTVNHKMLHYYAFFFSNIKVLYQRCWDVDGILHMTSVTKNSKGPVRKRTKAYSSTATLNST